MQPGTPFMPRCVRLLGARVLATMAGICGLACYSAEPATAGATNMMELSFDDLLNIKVDHVYGASRREQPISEAPSSVSIVTADEIKRFGHRDLADVLRSVRGFYVTYDRNYSYLGVRGFGRPSDYNARVLLLVNGHRVNENIYDSALIGREALLDVDNIERVEVIRGPSSSIYGNSAMLGVVNIVTRRGAQIDAVEVSAEGGSFETYKARLTAGKKYENGVEVLVSASGFTSENQDRLYYPEFNSGVQPYGVVRDEDGERGGNFLASVQYHDLTLTAALNARQKEIPTASFGSLFADGREQSLDVRGYVDLKYEKQVADDLKVLGRIYYDHYRYDATYPYDYETNVLLWADKVFGDAVGTEWQLTQTVLDVHTLTAGADFRENLRQDQLAYHRSRPREYLLDDERSSRNLGVYLQGEFAIRTNLLMNAGVRYDYYSSFGGSVSPRLAFIYKPWQPTVLKAVYGRAFRAPNAFELHYYPETGDLEAETLDTWELIWEQALPRGHKFTTSLYYYRLEDLISQAALPSGDIYYENLDHAHAAGAEFGIEGRYAGGAMARVSYAYQRAYNAESGDDLSNSPRHLAKLQVSVPVYRDKVFAGLEAQYHGSTRTLAGRREDDFTVVNFTLFAHRFAKNLEASASIYNLFDTRYAYPGAEDHVQDVIPQDGRSFRLKLTWKF
jgi:outer membrane receptor for ferrienterochelin and colicins